MKLKKDKGIGLTDAIIAIAIFIIFSGFIISISYNIYIQSNFIKRNDTATNYIVDLFEYAKIQNIEDVDFNKLSEYASIKFGNVVKTTDERPEQNSINKGYTIYIVVNDTHGDNIIKQIDITVYYKLGNKIKDVSMSTLITK